MKNATKYLVVGSLGVLMTRRDISSLAVKGLITKRNAEYQNYVYERDLTYAVCNIYDGSATKVTLA